MRTRAPLPVDLDIVILVADGALGSTSGLRPSGDWEMQRIPLPASGQVDGDGIDVKVRLQVEKLSRERPSVLPFNAGCFA